MDSVLSIVNRHKALETQNQNRIRIKPTQHTQTLSMVQHKEAELRNQAKFKLKVEIQAVQERIGKIIPPSFYVDVIKTHAERLSFGPSFLEGSAVTVMQDRVFVYGGLGGNGIKNNLFEFSLSIIVIVVFTIQSSMCGGMWYLRGLGSLKKEGWVTQY